MTTTTAAPAAAANGAQMGALLNERTTNRSIMDTIKAAPRKARAALAGVARTLHLEGLAGTVSDAGRWMIAKAARAGRFLQGFGIANIVGVLLTTPLRVQAVKVIKTVTRVVTYPVRLVGRALAWGLNKFGWGRKIVAKVQQVVTKVTTWSAHKLDQGAAWLASKDDNGAMSWLRWYFQATLVRKGLARMFPRLPGWLVYAAGLAIPVYGDNRSLASKGVSLVHAQAEEIVAEAEAIVATASEAKAEAKVVVPAPVVPVGHSETAILTDSTQTGDDKVNAEVVSYVPADGIRRVYFGGDFVKVEDLPAHITMVGTVVGEPIQDIVRKAQAKPSGKPPTLPRAGQRAARKASSGRR